MAWSFNVFTGNLDQMGSGAVVFEGEVATFADLPQTVGDPAVGSSYLVRESTGVWLVNRKQAGIWIRSNNTGVRDTDWTYGGDYPVNSVNGQTGNVSLTASSVGAAAATHASTHHTGGTDALAPSDIGAQSIFETESPQWSSDLTLTASRAKQYNAIVSANSNITLPTSGHLIGDVIVIWRIPTGNGTLTIRRGNPFISTWTIDFGQQLRFRATGTGDADWELVRVDTHTHTPSEVGLGNVSNTAQVTSVSGTAPIVSSGGTTPAISISAATTSAAGSMSSADKTKLDGIATGATANSSDATLFNRANHTGTQAHTTITGLGGAATLSVGTTSGTVAAGDDSRFHTRSHAMTGTSDHTASNWSVFYSNGSGQVTELALGAANTVLTSNGASSAPSFAAAAASGATNLWIPASAWIPRTTFGCGVDSREIGATNRANVDELLFDTGTEEFAQALVVMPSNYNNSTITARFYWTAASGSGGVAWGISGRAYGDDDALDQASGTRIVVTDTFITANDVHVTSATSAVTIAGTPAANKAVNFQIVREVGNGSDTLGVDARLLGVEIIFN